MTSTSIFTLDYREELKRSVPTRAPLPRTMAPRAHALDPLKDEPEPRTNGSAEPDRAAEPDAPPELMRSETTVLHGDVQIVGPQVSIRSDGCLEIYGRITGNLQSDKIVVGATGHIEGTVIARRVSVFGQVDGQIFGRHVDVYAGGGVEGAIHHRTLSIEKGGNFVGRSNRVLSPTDLHPGLGEKSSAADPKLVTDARKLLEPVQAGED